MSAEQYKSQLSNSIGNIYLSDTTQREGRQASGAHLSRDASLRHALLTSGVKIDYLELNHPASSCFFADLAKDIADLPISIKTATHVRCNKRDVQAALETGVRFINTYIPINPNSLTESRRSIQQALQNLKEIANMTQSGGVEELRVSVEHAFSLPLDWLQEIYGMLGSTKGIHRVGAANTTGDLFPQQVKEYADAIYKVIPETMAIQFHFHNDTGLAASQFLSVLELLAQNDRKAVFDYTIGGIGERNGILSLGDIFAILYSIDPIKLKSKYNIQNYAELYYHIASHIGIPIDGRDPISPRSSIHTSGPHQKGQIMRNSYQKIPPEEFGFEGIKLNVGHPVTGYEGVKAWVASTMGVTLPDEIAKVIAGEIRNYTSVNGIMDDINLQNFIGSLSTYRQLQHQPNVNA